MSSLPSRDPAYRMNAKEYIRFCRINQTNRLTMAKGDLGFVSCIAVFCGTEGCGL